MKKYIGTKVIMAEPMTMTEAQKVLSRELTQSNIEEDGYLVEYENGYKSWSPKSMFEKAYREVGSVNFGGAINLLKAGLAVRRKGWKKGLPPIIPAFPNYTPTKRVEYNTELNLVYILTKDGSVAVTDGMFYDIVSKYTWDKDSNGYISASFKDEEGFRPHRLQNYILPDIPSGYVIDHINGNKFDNRICNLRLATIKEDNANR